MAIQLDDCPNVGGGHRITGLLIAMASQWSRSQSCSLASPERRRLHLSLTTIHISAEWSPSEGPTARRGREVTSWPAHLQRRIASQANRAGIRARVPVGTSGPQ